MKKENKSIRRIINSVVLIVILIIFCIISGEMILKRMESYIEKNGRSNMATVMEQMSQSYDIQVDAYFRKLEQAEQFLFQNGQREITLETSKKYFDTVQPSDNTEELLFMKSNGEIMTTDGKKSHIDIQSQMLIHLNQNQKIAQSITMNLNTKRESYFLVAIPCETYTVNGEDYNVIAALYDRSNIDSLLELNGYGGKAYIFMVDENGIVNYTNQPEDIFYRNYAVIKHLRKEKVISDAQYEALCDTVKSNQKKVELFDESDRPFYLGCYPVSSSAHRLICIVSRSTVNNALLEYQRLMVRLLAVYLGIVLLLCIGLINNIFRVRASDRRMAYEEEKRHIQENAMKELEIERNRADEANRAKSDFLSNMSHDIRTPMNAIVGITKLMAHDKADADKMDLYIHKVQMSSQHLLSLINDVLDMSKIESSEVKLNQEPVSLAEQIGQIESIIRPQTEEREQELVIRTRNVTHEYLIGDAVRLRQIFINLLSNAVKYTPNGGRILLELEELPGEIPDHAGFRISVTDNGCGMTPEFMTHIFEPFTRAESSTTNREQGTGLGMAITKTIVDLMNGTISVKSELHRGSCFTVEIPFLIDDHTKAMIPAKRVLLISDEDSLIGNALAAFKETKSTLLLAKSEAEAEELLRQNEVDIVLLGSHLNGQLLKDNIQRLRKETGDALLFFCCDYEDREQFAGISAKNWVDGVLIRPFFLSGLAQAIEHAGNATTEDVSENDSILRGMKFLCAEDNELNAEILKAILDMNGAGCVICPNGEKIVNTFRSVKEGEFDAILMDVQMPVMNGLDAARAIRRSENPLGRTIPIIAMTANAFSDDIQNCLNAGMDAHVSKPLDIDLLKRTIKNVITGGQTKPNNN